MNITLALDEELVARARQVAQAEGRSLNDMIRAYLEAVAGRRPADAAVAQLQRLWRDQPGHSGGRRISRDEAYEGRV